MAIRSGIGASGIKKTTYIVADALVETMIGIVAGPSDGGDDLVATQRACHQRE